MSNIYSLTNGRDLNARTHPPFWQDMRKICSRANNIKHPVISVALECVGTHFWLHSSIQPSSTAYISVLATSIHPSSTAYISVLATSIHPASTAYISVLATSVGSLETRQSSLTFWLATLTTSARFMAPPTRMPCCHIWTCYFFFLYVCCHVWLSCLGVIWL